MPVSLLPSPSLGTPKKIRKVRDPNSAPTNPITPQVFGMLVDRLEAATAAGKITSDSKLYVAVLNALFPAEFHSVPAGSGPPSLAPPRSEERIRDYAARVLRQELLSHPGDVGSVADERIEMFVRALVRRGDAADDE